MQYLYFQGAALSACSPCLGLFFPSCFPFHVPSLISLVSAAHRPAHQSVQMLSVWFLASSVEGALSRILTLWGGGLGTGGNLTIQRFPQEECLEGSVPGQWLNLSSVLLVLISSVSIKFDLSLTPRAFSWSPARLLSSSSFYLVELTHV